MGCVVFIFKLAHIVNILYYRPFKEEVMRFLYSLFIFLFFFTGKASADLFIKKESGPAISSVYQYIGEHEYYNNFQEFVFVVDFTNGSVEKFWVTNTYDGESRLEISPVQATSEERNAFSQFVASFSSLWNEHIVGTGFHNVPESIVGTGLELGNSSTARNRMQAYLKGKLETNFVSMLEGVFVRASTYMGRGFLEDEREVALSDGTVVTVKVTYTRSSVKVETIKIVDKYFNTIEIRNGLVKADLTINANDADYFNTIMDFLNSTNMNISWQIGMGEIPGELFGRINVKCSGDGTCEITQTP